MIIVGFTEEEHQSMTTILNLKLRDCEPDKDTGKPRLGKEYAKTLNGLFKKLTKDDHDVFLQWKDILV